MQDYQQQFIQLALAHQALRFGEFTLKSGRTSPYFFNAGQFYSGSALADLGRCYAAALVASGIEFDMLFGPAYKGIPLVSSIAIALARDFGRDVPWCFNRKEAKDHGEGGSLVGAPLMMSSFVAPSSSTTTTKSAPWALSAGKASSTPNTGIPEA